MNKKGFTLIELILVIFIIGIATAIVGVTIYKSMDEVRLKTFAKEISSSLRYARSQAVAEKQVYSFVSNKNGYGVYTIISVNDPERQERVSSVLSKTVSDGIMVEYEGSGVFRIDFFPQGDSTGGKITLKNQKGSEMLITVDPITGKTRVETIQ